MKIPQMRSPGVVPVKGPGTPGTGPGRILRPVSYFLKNNEAPERGGREELQLESQEGQ